MKLNHDLMRDLIFMIEEKDMGRGVTFYDEDLSVFSETFQENAKTGLRLTAVWLYHLREMEQRQWIRFDETYGFSVAHILPQGHEAASFFRENTWPRRVIGYLAKWGDRLLQSVVIPIAVSLLTVLALEFFGLGK